MMLERGMVRAVADGRQEGEANAEHAALRSDAVF